MNGPTRASDSAFLRACQRLHAQRAAAKQAGDVETCQSVTDELCHLLMMNAAGRLDEYFASRGTGETA